MTIGRIKILTVHNFKNSYEFYYDSPEKLPIPLCIIIRIYFYFLHRIQTDDMRTYRNDIALSLRFIIKDNFSNIQELDRIFLFRRCVSPARINTGKDL